MSAFVTASNLADRRRSNVVTRFYVGLTYLDTIGGRRRAGPAGPEPVAAITRL